MAIDKLEDLRIHVLNVDHGDAIILELPNYRDKDNLEKAHFAIVDAGRPERACRDRPRDYLQALVKVRGLNEDDYWIDFVCITHPHEDHYGGLKRILESFESRILQFWDCGFRTAANTYNKILKQIAAKDNIAYMRIAAGFEEELGDTRVIALAPSLDLRNRFDTYGVDRNNASVVLKIQYKQSIAILTGDAFFDSWGKIAEEFPRRGRIDYYKDALADRTEPVNQLNCQLLKVAHHGSKHGTSLEYLEKLTPTHFVITCADRIWYREHKPGWGVQWPHSLALKAIEDLPSLKDIRYTYNGNIIYTLTGSNRIPPSSVGEVGYLPDKHPQFEEKLREILHIEN